MSLYTIVWRLNHIFTMYYWCFRRAYLKGFGRALNVVSFRNSLMRCSSRRLRSSSSLLKIKKLR